MSDLLFDLTVEQESFVDSLFKWDKDEYDLENSSEEELDFDY